MDFAMLPPEINSARMYSGPGAGPMIASAVAWDGLATELHSAAATHASVISELTSGPWQGPSSTAMAAAATQYVTWLTTAADHAEEAGTQTKQAVAAYEAAFALTVPPPVISANRSLLLALIATNFLGQNTAAIAATEAQYAEMWAQDAAAMYGYAGAAATAAKWTPLAAADQESDPTGVPGQIEAIAQAMLTDIETTMQNRLSTLLNAVPTALQGLLSATSPGDALASLSSLVTTFGGSNPFGYPVALVPAIGSMATANFGKGLYGKFVAKPAVPKPSAPPAVKPAQLAGDSLRAGLADASKAGVALSARTAAAGTIGTLSVPPSWTVAGPSIRPAAVTWSTAPVAVADEPGMLFSDAATATVAGRALGGVASRFVPRPPTSSRSGTAAPQTQAESLEDIHEAIIRDVLAGADFWGGFGSRACQEFITSLGHNFQVIYDHLQTHDPGRETRDSKTAGTDGPV